MKLNHPADTIVEGIVNSPINNLSAPNYWPLNEQCFPSYRNQSIHLHCKWINLFLYDRKHWSLHCVESVQIRSYFWSVFSCIRTGNFSCIFSVNLRIQSNRGKNGPEIPNLDTFHAVSIFRVSSLFLCYIPN